MGSKEERIKELFERWYHNEINAAEKQELADLLSSVKLDEEISPLIRQIWEQVQPETIFSAAETDRLVDRILQLAPSEKETSEAIVGKRTLPARFRWIRYAAAAVLILGIAGYFWLNDRPEDKSSLPETSSLQPADKLPGSDRAILTLSDGRQVVLGDGDEVLDDSGVEISKRNGELVYRQGNIVAFNTMTTPRGGQYRLTLPDGSRVWLNAVSSIHYPTAFTGNTRNVKITGEVYFEVHKDVSKPFHVEIISPSTGGKLSEVEVLGTAFNISAYDDEPAIRTTLLEGSVKIGDNLLRPGQAFANGKIEEADVSRAIAWKNGIFDFNDADLPSVLRQLSRWYDVEVEYPQTVSKRIFGGKMEKSLRLSQVLEVLEEMEVHFTINESGKLLVLP